MSKANRVDANQSEIIAALRAIGATVQPLNAVKDGCPDLLVGYRRKNYLFEIKTDKGTLTPDEVTWHAGWNGRAYIVHTATEAIDILMGGEELCF